MTSNTDIHLAYVVVISYTSRLIIAADLIWADFNKGGETELTGCILQDQRKSMQEAICKNQKLTDPFTAKLRTSISCDSSPEASVILTAHLSEPDKTRRAFEATYHSATYQGAPQLEPVLTWGISTKLVVYMFLRDRMYSPHL